MKYWYLTLLVIALAACAEISSASSSLPEASNLAVASLPLPDLGPAPELTNQVWLNTDDPLRLADLRGKVVLLEMWTFG